MIFAVVARRSAPIVLAKTRWGYETFATGGNEQAAIYAGIPTRWVRIRAYLISSLCATLAGLMRPAQDKGVTPLYGLSAELIVIASVIIGGASILGGRGRVVGTCLGAVLTVLINKVLREGWPITRIIKIDGEEMTVNAVFSLPAGAVPAFLGAAPRHRGADRALSHPPPGRRRGSGPGCAAGRRRRPTRSAASRIEGAQTKGAMATDMALSATGLGKFLARRDALAIILTVVLWLAGLYLRPDYWWNLPNTFAILLNYTELALITVGLTYVIAAGDIDLSVGAVLALAGSTAAYFLKVLGVDPVTAVAMGLLAGTRAGVVNAVLTVGFGLPAFIATLGMFYIARGLAAWFVAGQQLTGLPEGFNLLGRKVDDILLHFGIRAARRDRCAPSPRWSACRPSGCSSSPSSPASCSPTCRSGRRSTPPAATSAPPPMPASTPTGCASSSLVLAALCATMAGIINVAYFRSFNPVAGQFRELDAIAAVIIGGGSIFGGYGTIIGALAGAAVITLVRALLQLNVQGFTHAAALDQRLHRRHPDRRRADRHLGAPGQHLRPPAGTPRTRRARTPETAHA